MGFLRTISLKFRSALVWSQHFLRHYLYNRNMNEDIVCLLQDLGPESSVDVIANFILRNPEAEDRIAARMGSLLSSDGFVPTTPATSTMPDSNPTNTSAIPNASSLAYSNLVEYKMIFVVNMDLNMGRGKQCAQVAHAALGLYLKIQQESRRDDQTKLLQWISLGQKKIVVRGNNLAHLKTTQENANEANLPNILISDAGCTQIAPGSKTVLAIFGSNEDLDSVTGSLKLL